MSGLPRLSDSAASDEDDLRALGDPSERAFPASVSVKTEKYKSSFSNVFYCFPWLLFQSVGMEVLWTLIWVRDLKHLSEKCNGHKGCHSYNEATFMMRLQDWLHNTHNKCYHQPPLVISLQWCLLDTRWEEERVLCPPTPSTPAAQQKGVCSAGSSTGGDAEPRAAGSHLPKHCVWKLDWKETVSLL